MKMERYIKDLLKDYKDISYEIVEITTDEDENFKVIDLHSSSLEADENLDFLFDAIVKYTFENRLYEYLCNLYFYKESEEYKNVQQPNTFEWWDSKIVLDKMDFNLNKKEIHFRNESKDFSEVCSEELEMAA